MGIFVSQPQYIKTEHLGSGGFGDVYKAINSINGEVVAVKTFKDSSKYAAVQNEIDALNIAAHKNVVQLKGHYIDNETNEICMVMEFCPQNNIEHFIENNPSHRVPRVGFLQDIASGIAYIHGRNIVHRDLKPANILVTYDGARHIAKLADFGIAKIMTTHQDRKQWGGMYARTKIGTAPYMAPEVLSEDNTRYGLKVDIFSMGLVFCVIYGLKERVEKECIGANLNASIQYQSVANDIICKGIKKDRLRILITRMIQFDPNSRPDAEGVKKSVMSLE
ncbi:serine/threonine-protein kinase ULK3-like [Antedon mediterranea]|uniref:serine/threonine-protein kinase ULK3-like n=1 Tax=Antedon mediterranea TaxID=105859 RepID=UPI003AF82E34